MREREDTSTPLNNYGLLIDPVDLTGWSLVDHQARVQQLDGGVLPPGEALRLQPPVQLSNKGC